jgi:hypothetical protein
MKKVEKLQFEPSKSICFEKASSPGNITKTSLRIYNPCKETVYLKMKSTAPNHFYAKPNRAILEADQFVIIDIHLNKNEIFNETKNDRIMVQYIHLNEELAQLKNLNIFNLVN